MFIPLIIGIIKNHSFKLFLRILGKLKLIKVINMYIMHKIID